MLPQNQFLPFLPSTLFFTLTPCNRNIGVKKQEQQYLELWRMTFNREAAWVAVLVEAQHSLWCNHKPTTSTIAWHFTGRFRNSSPGVKSQNAYPLSIRQSWGPGLQVLLKPGGRIVNNTSQAPSQKWTTARSNGRPPNCVLWSSRLLLTLWHKGLNNLMDG